MLGLVVKIIIMNKILLALAMAFRIEYDLNKKDFKQFKYYE